MGNMMATLSWTVPFAQPAPARPASSRLVRVMP